MNPIARIAVSLALAAGLAGCAGLERSEMPVDASQVAQLPTGISKQDLLERLGPPAEEGRYRSETVMSWRLIEPGSRHFLFNAHLDPSGRVVAYSRTIDPATAGDSGMGR